MRLAHRVALLKPVTSSDGYGGRDEVRAERFRAKADIRYLRGGEEVQAARLAGRQPAVVTIRAFSASREVTTGWTVRDLRRGVDYNVRSVVPSYDRRHVEITCESGIAL